jgi:mRNA interferase RelE/StbE
VHRVLLEAGAEADMRALPAREFARVVEKIRGLSENPRPPGCRKIVGSQSDWRLRVGAYRVLYEVDDTERTVTVMRVRHRRIVYR